MLPSKCDRWRKKMPASGGGNQNVDGLLVERLEVIAAIHDADQARSDAKKRLAKIHAELTRLGHGEALRPDW
jgi:hypothetical protein